MYQVLYRKYRPKVFSDVYGQDHVTSTLKNEIKNGRVSHAYLFTGSRGTGKTTCAKILAKAVNCEHNVDGEPCNECEVCKGLDNGSIYDVVEIDAASNNGVDNIRELRDETNYAPSRGKYRVYIIDEVHMLSTGAFNALLKTLEEPPAHVIFILATTEVHKLPATILSRCQRFDFKRIQPETMAVRLKEVAGLEGLNLDDDAAVLIARIADGALRDGLSILDQCAGRSKEINSDLVSEVAGLAGREAMYKLSDCIANSDSNTAMSIISDLYQNSFDMERLCVEMINHFRNFLVAKTVRKSRELIICTDDEYNTILEASKEFTVESIVFALDLFQNTLVTIKGGASARIEVEMAFIKLCEPRMDESIASLLDRVSKLENAIKSGVKVQPTQTAVPAPKEEYVPKEEPKPQPKAEPTPVPMPEPEPTPVEEEPPVQEQQPVVETPPVEHKTAPPVANPNETVEFTQWGDFMDVLHRTNIPLFGVLSGSKGYVRGEFFLLDSPNPAVRDFIKLPIHSKSIKAALLEVTGVHFKLGLFKRPAEQSAPKRDPLEDLINQAQGSVNIEFK
ncbi:DNA polymerase III subunit gamma/tau [Eubacterium coprostanoligenes]|uniref:DNA polymerase III subunit gamma/tau n=1 Tax=Eubacterium coprostanoligenes TaxID=290054 RepID=UPI002353F3B3|nr:DNA polymerase III subunit gamma/tau [Eubacterium coprostanoligenes]MCI6353564.1 DNA polymerase III subunit gamma/tau [Eubacterium coprostanoligenes]MCI7264069.1 DNA polymerase III subunit gamma/tau [Eubacterium coprostanoligenes]